jgi:hypothetical protein
MMKYPLQQLLNLGVVPPVTFPTDSRYYAFAVQQYEMPDGSTVPYLARRIVPQPGAPNYSTINTCIVQQGNRLDQIAAKYLGDPLMSWLLCDANGAIDPNDLTATPGTSLNITTPQGVPGGSIAQ